METGVATSADAEILGAVEEAAVEDPAVEERDSTANADIVGYMVIVGAVQKAS